MDQVENIRAFLTVAQSSSFVVAADRLGLSSSVVSKRIRQLEWRLGGPLLNRTTRSVALTDLGARQMRRMLRLMREYDDLCTDAMDHAQALEGNLRLSAPAAMTTVLLGEALAAYRRLHPAVRIELRVLDRTVNPAEENLDLSLLVLPSICKEVVEEVLCPYPRVLCAAPSYLAARGTPQQPQDLLEHDCIMFTPSTRSWTFLGRTRPVMVAIQPTMSSSDSRVLIDMVRCGLGLSVLSRLTVADLLARGELVAVMPDYPMPDLQVKALIPEACVSLARVNAMVDCIRACLLKQHIEEASREGKNPKC